MSEIYKKVAIVIPTHKAKLNSDEEISIKCLDRNLNNFDKFWELFDSRLLIEYFGKNLQIINLFYYIS